MPLIFTSSDETESGLSYADRTGVSYEFPKMYRRRVVPGTRFLYYRGRRRVGGGRQPQVYFGFGLVGAVATSDIDRTRLACEILDYVEFQTPVPFRSTDGSHLESKGARKGYFQQGVRSIDDDTYERILTLGIGDLPPPGSTQSAGGRGLSSYPSPEAAAAVDEYAMEVALAHVQILYSNATIVRQPHNNPGFDIRVESDDGTTRYIEVKGTRSDTLGFFLSEGERRFSLEHPHDFSLVLVSQIDLVAKQHEIRVYDGPLDSEYFGLRPTQWTGRFPLSKTPPASNIVADGAVEAHTHELDH